MQTHSIQARLAASARTAGCCHARLRLGPPLFAAPHHRPPPVLLTPIRRRVAAGAAEVEEVQTAEQGELSLELPTADVQQAVRLMGVRQGRGAAIVVDSVDPGSAAAAAGCRPGQQLLAVSDPIRRNERWELNGQSSLRYTQQAIRMRVADTITLVLTAEPIPEWRRAVEAARAAQRAAQTQLEEQQQQEVAAAGEAAAAGGQDGGREEEEDLLSAIVRSASGSLDDGDDGVAASASAAAAAQLGAQGSDAAAEKLTVAEKLEAQYQAAQQGEASLQKQLTDLERRQKRRKEYFQQQSQRNDAPFFAAVATLFFLPPAIILAYAFASGYIDSLDMYGLMR